MKQKQNAVNGAIGEERQTYTYRGIVFRTEHRKIHELYDPNTIGRKSTTRPTRTSAGQPLETSPSK